MRNKVFAKQLTLLVLGTAVLFLAACSEIVDLPETSETPQATEQQTSLAAPIIIGTSATSTSNSTEPQTPAPQPTPAQGEPTPTPVTEPQITEPQTTEPTTPEPVVTEPQVTPEPQPVTEPQTAPVISEPVVTPTPVTVNEPQIPVTSEPIVTTPVTPEPVITTPVTPEPVAFEPQTPVTPIVTAPVPQPVSEPVVPEPVVTEPVVTEPVVTVTQPIVSEPVITEPIEPIVTEPKNPSTVWQPTPGTTWQWQLSGNLDLSLDVAMYDLDLFDTEQRVIDQLHAEGRIVICYFSAGTLEPWRTDVKDFPKEVIGSKMLHWDEYWLDISNIEKLASIMTARLDLAVEKNCDGVEPDNIDSYQNKSGFPLTAQNQLDYNKFLALEAHKRGLSIGLKNDLDQVVELEPYFDWALNESCFQYNECHKLSPFVENNKAVFGVEYIASPSEFCDLVNGLDFDFLKKDYDLSAAIQPCRTS